MLNRKGALNSCLINKFKKFVKMNFFKLRLPLFDEQVLTLYKDQGQKQTSGLVNFKKYPQALVVQCW